MAANAIAGVGTQFLRWNTNTNSWDAIAGVKNITGPSKTRAFIDVTSLDSTGGYREFIAGFRDSGTLTFTFIFERDGYENLNADFESDTAQNYQIVLPDTDVTSLAFEGLVTELPLTIPTDDAVTCDVTIKITGVVTLESGSAPSPA
jgi:predicted secreted protein